MKRVILIVLITLVIIILVGFLSYIIYFSYFFEISGKDVIINVKEGVIFDYSLMEQYILINQDTRDELVQYMKENNLRVKPGRYELRQGTPFKKALRILKFIEIEEE